MKHTGLTESELTLINDSLSRCGDVTGAILFGSRAMGKSSKASDIDIALEGIDDDLRAEAIASLLEELPLPYRFDVLALSSTINTPIGEHIARAGVRIYGYDTALRK